MLKINFYSALVLAMLLAGCSNQADTNKDKQINQSETAGNTESIPPVKETKSKLSKDAPTYNIYIESRYPPFAFKDEFGNPAGFDIEILNAIGEVSGFHTNFNTTDWYGIFDNLDDGKADIVSSGVTVTGERQDKMLFSDPYLDTIAVIAYNSPDVKSYDTLSSGTFGILKGSSHLTQIINNGIPESQIKEFPTNFLAVQGLLSSQVDMIVDDEVILNYNLQSIEDSADISNIKTTSLPGSESYPMAFAVAKNRPELVVQLNEGLQTIRSNGTYDEIYTKWFGDTKLVK